MPANRSAVAADDDAPHSQSPADPKVGAMRADASKTAFMHNYFDEMQPSPDKSVRTWALPSRVIFVFNALSVCVRVGAENR